MTGLIKLIEASVSRLGVLRPKIIHRNKTTGKLRLVQADMGDGMIEQPSQSQENLDDMVHQQLDHYAGELRDLFHNVRQLRKELEEKNQQLVQRVRELTALNRLFQEHLLERYAQD